MINFSDFKATRDSYGETLIKLGGIYNNLVVLDADLAKATKTEMFMKKFPERFFNCGIAECNMMGVAAGLATTDKKVFVSSFAMFAVGRAFEIIRNSIAYPNLNVKIAATHAGISVGEDGATHQCCEDILLMRSLPNMTVISPVDDIETKCAIEQSFSINTPIYFRLGRLPFPVINNQNSYKFEIGKAIQLTQGKDVSIIATGLMVSEALKAESIIREQYGCSARVINIHTIKPIDIDIIVDAAKNSKFIITIEEHSIIGGLGSAVCDVVSEYCPVKVIKIGVNDCFGMSGPPYELLKFFGLHYENIVNVFLNNK